jgi:hypothetical protein
VTSGFIPAHVGQIQFAESVAHDMGSHRDAKRFKFVEQALLVIGGNTIKTEWRRGAPRQLKNCWKTRQSR